MKNKVTEYNICNGDIRWQILKSIYVILLIFTTPVADSEIFTIQIVYINNLDQTWTWNWTWQEHCFITCTSDSVGMTKQ